jgi:hypothetical protein
MGGNIFSGTAVSLLGASFAERRPSMALSSDVCEKVDLVAGAMRAAAIAVEH